MKSPEKLVLPIFPKDQDTVVISLKKQMFSMWAFLPLYSHPEAGSSIFLKMPTLGGLPSQLWEFGLDTILFLSFLVGKMGLITASTNEVVDIT